MSGTGKFSTYHVPDDGVLYVVGETVRLDRSTANVKIIQDATGDYEVYSCRPATEFTRTAPLLRVGLRRVNF